jgi:hypothetical protein
MVSFINVAKLERPSKEYKRYCVHCGKLFSCHGKYCKSCPKCQIKNKPKRNQGGYLRNKRTILLLKKGNLNLNTNVN